MYDILRISVDEAGIGSGKTKAAVVFLVLILI